MTDLLHNKIRQSLQQAEELYFRLVLLAGPEESRKSAALREFAEELGTSVINVNLELSRQLLDLTAGQRSLRLPEIFKHIVEQAQPPVILDHLEILFDQQLQLDPLRLLQTSSRNFTVLASWNGSVNSGKLEHADPSHPEYRRYDQVDALIINM